MITFLASSVTRFLACLSLEAQRRLGRWLGRLAWLLNTGAARTTKANLAMCFPDLTDEQRRDLAMRSLEHTGQLFTEAGIVFHWPRTRWRRVILGCEGAGLIERALSESRPVLVLVPHYGNWEILSLFLGGYGITALYDPPRVSALEPLIVAARSRAGATLLPIDAAGIRRFYRAFKAGGLAGVLPDQVPDRQAGVYAEFFGVPALTMTFAHKLINTTRALVLMGSASRCPGGFVLRFEELGGDIRHPDAEVSARAMNRAIEDLVRQDPAQYQWEYKRFKRPPPGAPKPYDGRRGCG